MKALHRQIAPCLTLLAFGTALACYAEARMEADDAGAWRPVAALGWLLWLLATAWLITLCVLIGHREIRGGRPRPGAEGREPSATAEDWVRWDAEYALVLAANGWLAGLDPNGSMAAGTPSTPWCWPPTGGLRAWTPTAPWPSGTPATRGRW